MNNINRFRLIRITIVVVFLVTTIGLILCNIDNEFTNFAKSIVTTNTKQRLQNRTRHQNQKHRQWQNDDDFTNYKSLKDCLITDIFQDENRNLWVGTQKNGLWEKQYSAMAFEEIKQFNGNYVTQIIADRSNDIWIGTKQNGIWEKLDADANWTQQAELKGNWITVIFSDKQQHLLVGTFGNGLWEQNKMGIFIQNKKIFDNGTRTITTIFQDKENNLWIGTADVDIWEKLWGKTPGASQYIKYSPNPKGWGGNIHTFFEDSQSNLWVGTQYNGVWELKHKASSFTRSLFLSGNFFINKIINDKDDNLWFATSDVGLWEKKAASDTATQISGLEYCDIKTIFFDKDFNLWIGTLGSGLCEIEKSHPAVVVHIATSNIGKTQVDIIFQDYDENLWICQTRIALWEKNMTGVFAQPTWRSRTYTQNSKYNTIFRTPFSIRINEPNIATVLINSIIAAPAAQQDYEFNFPDPKYKAVTNKRITMQINYQDGTPSYHANYLIKGAYNDTGQQGHDKIIKALKSSGGKGQSDQQVRLKGDPTNTQYHLFSDLSLSLTSNPNLTINTTKLNFLTDFAHSSYSRIHISDGQITKGLPVVLSTSPALIYGASKNNLWEVELCDYLGNQEHFLIQEGGARRNQNFITIRHSIWRYIAIIEGVALGVIIIIICVQQWLFFSHRRLRRLLVKKGAIRSNNTNRQINIFKLKHNSDKEKKVKILKNKNHN